MVKSIKWNKQALLSLHDIVGYLQAKATDKVANNFVDAVYFQIERLKKQPQLGRPVPTKKTIRFLNIDKHRQMFYRMKGTTLHIANFFDTRQNPNKRPY
jgi:plasmid stabilization system protein ParE